MIKRLSKWLVVAVVINIMLCQAAFAAGGLVLESAHPEDGGTGYFTTNQMARLVFSGDVSKMESDAYFKVYGPENQEEELKIVSEPDNPKRMNLVFIKELEQNAEYRIVIDKSLQDAEGNTLGEDVVITFRTKNTATDGVITMVLMGLMFGAIIFFTVRDQRKQMEEQRDTGKKKEQKVNPYKEAKKEAEKIVAEKKKERKEKVAQYSGESANSQKKKKKKK